MCSKIRPVAREKYTNKYILIKLFHWTRAERFSKYFHSGQEFTLMVRSIQPY